MKLKDLYEIASKVQSYPFLSNASIINVNASLEIPLQTVCFVENSDVVLDVPKFPSNGSSFAIISKNSRFLLRVTVDNSSHIRYLQENKKEVQYELGDYSVFYIYDNSTNRWNLVHKNVSSISCKNIGSTSNLVLNSESASTQSLNPLEPAIVKIKKDFVGSIINIGDGTYPIILKNFLSSETICELSIITNIRSVSVYFDTNLQEFVAITVGIYSSFGYEENLPLEIYDGEDLAADEVRKLKFQDGLFNINQQGQSAILSFNNTAFLKSNTQTLTGNKTLNQSDAFFQLLNPNGQNRSIIVSNSWTGKIINNSDGIYSLTLLNTNSEPLGELSNSIGVKAVSVWFDGTSHVILQESSYSYENISFVGFITTNVKTSDYVAKNGERILCDTSAGSFKITTPSYGRFQIVDATNGATSEQDGFGENNLLVETSLPNKILGQTSILLNKGLVAAEFEFISSQKDWKLLSQDMKTDGINTFSIRGEIKNPTQGQTFILISKDSKRLKIKSFSGFTSSGLCTISIKKGGTLSLQSLSYLNLSTNFSKHQNTSSVQQEILSLDQDFYSIEIISQIETSNLSYVVWLESF